MIGRAIDICPDNAFFYYDRGLMFQEIKQLDAAVSSYDQAISIKPDFVEAYYNRGLVLQGLNQLDAAVASYDRAISIKPSFAEAYSNRGLALQELNQLDAAVASYDQAISIKPNYAKAYCNRGSVLQELKQLDAALTSYDRAISIKSDYAEAYSNRGNVLHELKQLDSALASYDRAISINPDYAEAYSNRGNTLKELKQLDAAIASYDWAISIKPDYAEAYCNRGLALQALNQLDAALVSYDRAISIKPDYADAYFNRGTALQELRQLDVAMVSYDRAISIKPDYAEAYANRGVALLELKQLDAAVDNFNRSISIKADYAEAYWNKSLALLLGGHFAKGWELYEWRWKIKSLNNSYPRWHGNEDINGKSILIYPEQGLGDFIKFCRYVPMVEALGAKVILKVPDELRIILATLQGGYTILKNAQLLPHIDFQCPIMSLPLAFNTTLSTIPNVNPYLKADLTKVQLWREFLGGKTKLRVGLVWSGGFRPNQPEIWAVNRRRNIKLAMFEGFKKLDIEFYSLQKGQSAETELSDLIAASWDGPTIHDFTSRLNDFSDTAALIENLDLVISVDTSTAHLAAALGKTVWILNRFDSCWRWMLDRSDSPWYPTVTLFRQSSAGDWTGVIADVTKRLETMQID